MLDWQAEFNLLNDSQRERFTFTISKLYNQCFFMRDEWDHKEGQAVPNPDYRFVEKNAHLFREYLSASGWVLDIDGQLGVMGLYNRFGHNRQSVGKVVTYFLFCLRLIFDESMEKVTSRRMVIVQLKDILDKFHTLNLTEKRFNSTQIRDIQQKLRKMNVIERVDGEALSEDSRWIIHPCIKKIVSDERINAIDSLEVDDETDQETDFSAS